MQGAWLQSARIQCALKFLIGMDFVRLRQGLLVSHFLTSVFGHMKAYLGQQLVAAGPQSQESLRHSR